MSQWLMSPLLLENKRSHFSNKIPKLKRTHILRHAEQIGLTSFKNGDNFSPNLVHIQLMVSNKLEMAKVRFLHEFYRKEN